MLFKIGLPNQSNNSPSPLSPFLHGSASQMVCRTVYSNVYTVWGHLDQCSAVYWSQCDPVYASWPWCCYTTFYCNTNTVKRWRKFIIKVLKVLKDQMKESMWPCICIIALMLLYNCYILLQYQHWNMRVKIS